MSKALNRAYDRRQKARAKKFIPWGHGYDPDAEAVGKHATTRHRCSCPCCGNQRRSVFAKGKEKITRQERIQKEREAQDGSM